MPIPQEILAQLPPEIAVRLQQSVEPMSMPVSGLPPGYGMPAPMSPAMSTAPPPNPGLGILQQILAMSQPSPAKASSKKEVFGNALGDFLTAIGAGLSNRGRGGQSTGAGAALQTPILLMRQREQMRQQMEQQERENAMKRLGLGIEAAKLGMPGPPRNIDPLSNTGIEAEVRKQEALLKMKPPPAPGEPKTVTLPDGTVAMFNETSRQWEKINLPGNQAKQATLPNQGFRDRFDSRTGHTFRDYFNQADPSRVVSSEDLGPQKPSISEPGTYLPLVEDRKSVV